MLKHTIYLVILATAFAGCKASAQSVMHSVEVKISTSTNTYKAGSQIPLDIVIKNTWSESIWVLRVGGEVGIGLLFDVQVTKDSGESAIETDSGKYARGHSNIPRAISGPSINLKPGEDIKFVSNINETFDMSSPGTYKITCSYKDPITKSEVMSNPLLVTIVK